MPGCLPVKTGKAISAVPGKVKNLKKKRAAGLNSRQLENHKNFIAPYIVLLFYLIVFVVSFTLSVILLFVVVEVGYRGDRFKVQRVRGSYPAHILHLSPLFFCDED